jgi:hypothetical protein
MKVKINNFDGNIYEIKYDGRGYANNVKFYLDQSISNNRYHELKGYYTIIESKGFYYVKKEDKGFIPCDLVEEFISLIKRIPRLDLERKVNNG